MLKHSRLINYKYRINYNLINQPHQFPVDVGATGPTLQCQLCFILRVKTPCMF